MAPEFKVSIYQVDNSYILPYLVQKALAQKKADVILAVSVTVGIQDSTPGTLNSLLVTQLLQLGIASGIPVVPALALSPTVTELKASLPENAAFWLQSVKDLTALLAPVDVTNVSTSAIEEVCGVYILLVTTLTVHLDILTNILIIC